MNVLKIAKTIANSKLFLCFLSICGLAAMPETASAQIACSAYSSTASGTGFYSLPGTVSVPSGGSINFSVTAAGGVATTVFFGAGSQNVTGSGSGSVAAGGSGSTSGTVDVQSTGGSSTVTANCTPGTTTSGGSSGDSADEMGEGFDENLGDIFSETEDGDLFGKYGIGDPFEEEEEGTGEETDDEGEPGPGFGYACSSCRSELRAIGTQISAANNKFETLAANLNGLQNREPAALEAAGIGLPRLIQAHPQKTTLDGLNGDLDANGADLGALARQFPNLANDFGVGQRTADGGYSMDDPQHLQNVLQRLPAVLGRYGAKLQGAEYDNYITLIGLAKDAVQLTQSVSAQVAAVSTTGPASPVTAAATAKLFIDTYSMLISVSNAVDSADSTEETRQLVDSLQALQKLSAERARLASEAADLAEQIREDAQAQQDQALSNLINQQTEALDAQREELDRLLNRQSRKASECQRLCTQASASASGSTAFAFSDPNGKPRASGSTFNGVMAYDNGFLSNFDLRRWRNANGGLYSTHGLSGVLADPRFNLFFSSSASFSQDTRPAGQDGVSFSVSGGASWMATPRLNVGAAFSFSDSDVGNATSSMNSATWSAAAFAQSRLPWKLKVDGAASIGVADVETRQTSGGTTSRADFQALSFSSQLKLSKPFKLDQINVTPHGSITLSHSQREGFTASDGTGTNGVIQNGAVLNAGLSLGTSLQLTDDLTLSPNAGFGTFGSLTDPGSLGLSASGGLSLKNQYGASGSLNSSFSRVSEDQFNWSIGARLSIPFGN